LARRSGHRLMIRLVKGAYWDAEIKRAQRDGFPDYTVYTRKAHTDLCYLVCAQRLLAAADAVYPQFATHNALTLATIVAKAERLGVRDFEFQCLHGMGESLYDQVVGSQQRNFPCRIYAPVGSHETLLAYLVRRLLENGANSSFVNQVLDPAVSDAMLLRDPVAAAQESQGAPHPAIPLPDYLFGAERINSPGIDLDDEHALHALADAMQSAGQRQWQASPLLAGSSPACGTLLNLRNPACPADIVGTVYEANADDVGRAYAAAARVQPDWQSTSSETRAAILFRAAALYEQHGAELMALAIREAGKTLPNAVGELRESIDFLRYYGAQISAMADASPLGSIVCISPWNFPLSIFTGQIAAALAAGNTVLAKPAEQTPLIACRAVQLLHEAGVPHDALLFLPGRGETIGAQLVADPRCSGVLFTGSTEIARDINRSLARRAASEQREIALLAETGGQNALIADSSALREQLVRDVLSSAFDSAGQRCSALRVLCLQNDIADATLAMLHGALRELQTGRPDSLATDIGPVIDAEAQQKLLAYIASTRAAGHCITQFGTSITDGCFVPPTIIEIDRIADLQHEIFGPVLHVLRYAREALPQLIADINGTGYGLTLGIHSRIDDTIHFIIDRARVGNVYVNRNMIGAAVGVQPFGGEGLSGTGPKAGGPLYLHRLQSLSNISSEPILTVESTLSSNDETLAMLTAWGDSIDPHFAALCRRYARDSLYGKTIRLPGPTGESNELRFRERGDVLCLSETAPVLLNQLAAVFATGNRLVLMQAVQALLPPTLPPEIRARIEWMGSLTGDKKLALVLHDAASFDLLPLIAERIGPIAPTVLVEAQQAIPLWRLVAEQAVCINTAAAGGNAALMTIDV
ncbi:MAG TPA: bifunctional proline dehydrogenase/L-glutamate gamma-semialdehyde dehydrogenase PutA, partial [Oxalicibacterium sp.]|nr:bifunctional proline dehydrogenase/L-glutamate gamma-semialdehyde dehydrogenase PutA [Oxalicibacterium sp.]